MPTKDLQGIHLVAIPNLPETPAFTCDDEDHTDEHKFLLRSELENKETGWF